MWGLESRSLFSVTAGGSFSLLRIEGERTGLSLLQRRGTGPCDFFVLSFFYSLEARFAWKNKRTCMVKYPMSWCVSESGWMFCSVALKESLAIHRIHPVSSFYAPFSSRWDEFGQNCRGSESTAAPRRGPRVSFTENFKQQSRNCRELKQRVFRHRVGRYTVRVLLASPFFFPLSAVTVYFTCP